jgi:hypothetical protein
MLVAYETGIVNAYMGYPAVWKVLEELIADFRKRGKTIPPQVMNDLKSAKTMIQISRAEKEYSETVQKTEEYLTNVESYLVSEGEKQFGFEYIDEWLCKLKEASKIPDASEKETRFIQGVLRGEKWVRVKATTELPIEKLRSLASESQLLCKLQKDGYLLVHGKEEHVKDFIKKMATKYGLKSRK